MPTLLETLASYVPSLVVRRFADDPAPIVAPSSEPLTAAIFFADISGFTALTERLARRGPAGAEEVSHLLNTYFGQLIELVSAHGGDVVKFAGDALLALWPAEEESLEVVTRRAAQCGLAVQKMLFDYDTAHHVRLSLRVGIGAGELTNVHIGGVKDRWEFLTTGAPLTQISPVKREAQPGEVIVSAEAWSLIAPWFTARPLTTDSLRLESVRETLPTQSAQPPALLPEMEGALRGYVSGAIRDRLAAGQTGWLAELRRLTVIFVSLPNVHSAALLGLKQAQMIMRVLQTALYRYEGSIKDVSVDDTGANLVAALGLPPWAHEDDALRGAKVALDMQAALRELGLRPAIGVATGLAFCGSVGTETRREYTMVGDVVNLAARLRQAARDDIFCDAATFQAAQSHMTFEPLPPIRVKGKAEPVAIFRPLLESFEANRASAASARAPGHAARVEMVGRAAERALLRDRLQAVQDGNPSSVIVIEGEPGIGKSRLVENLLDQARAMGAIALIGTGDAIEQSTPYHAWRPIFSQLLGFEADGERTARRKHVLSLLGRDPELLRLAPLLNAVLPLDMSDNELTAQMVGQVRADNTRRLLVSLLAKMPGGDSTSTRQSPKLLILEDAHWLDSASWALAWQVSHEIPSVLIVISSRPIDDPLPLEYSQLLHALDTHRIRLGPLPAEDALAMVCRRLGVASVPEAVRTLILDRAEGHPFFSEELAYALRDAGLILIEDGECRIAPQAGDLRALDLPDTVQGVITGRIDRLGPPQQLTLKVASVIGRVFALAILSAIHPIESDRPRLPEYLDALARLDITPLESPEPELAYIFKHIITHEVAYNLMLFSQRRQLHRAVAEWYEQMHAGELAPFHPLLAHHWGMAEDTTKALGYLEKAGEQALRGGAYREAVGFFNEAIALNDRARVTDDQGRTARDRGASSPSFRRAHWARQLGEAYLGLGKLPESRKHLEEALSLLGQPAPASHGQALTKLIGQLSRQVLHRSLPGRFVGRARAESNALLEAARAYERLSEIYYFSQERPLLLNAAFQALNLSERAGPSPELARAYANMCVVAGLVPLRRLARAYADRALDTAETSGQASTQARVRSRISLYALGIGRWAQAGENLDRAIEIADGLGDQRQWGESSALRAQLHYYLGEYAHSRQKFAEVLQRARHDGNVQFQAWGLWGQSHSLVRLGQLDEAVTALNTALEVLAELNDRGSEILTTGLLAVAYLYQGKLEQARSAADAVVSMYAEASGRFSLADLEGHAGAAEVLLMLWESGEQAGVEGETSAASAIAAAHGYARIYTIGRPRAWLLQGLYDWLSGKSRRAEKLWHKSLSVAEQLGMPYEQGRAHLEIGRHLSADDRNRTRHLQRALEIFSRIGAAHHANETRQALDR